MTSSTGTSSTTTDDWRHLPGDDHRGHPVARAPSRLVRPDEHRQPGHIDDGQWDAGHVGQRAVGAEGLGRSTPTTTTTSPTILRARPGRLSRLRGSRHRRTTARRGASATCASTGATALRNNRSTTRRLRRLYGNNVIVAHDYNVTTDGTIRTITVTAEDWLGQKSAAFSRRVTLKTGFEANLDEI